MKFNFKTKLILKITIALGCINSVFASECNPQKLNEIFSLLAQRNNLEEGVAAYKFIQKKSIFDSGIELNSLNDTYKIAEENKINPNDLMVFAQIQMDQAKFIQQYWTNIWIMHPDMQPDPDITPGIDTLKSQINSLDNRIYRQLADNINLLQVCSQDEMLKQMTKATSKTKGIPQNPDYNRLTVSAISNISPVGQ